MYTIRQHRHLMTFIIYQNKPTQLGTIAAWMSLWRSLELLRLGFLPNNKHGKAMTLMLLVLPNPDKDINFESVERSKISKWMIYIEFWAWMWAHASPSSFTSFQNESVWHDMTWWFWRSMPSNSAVIACIPRVAKSSGKKAVWNCLKRIYLHILHFHPLGSWQ